MPGVTSVVVDPAHFAPLAPDGRRVVRRRAVRLSDVTAAGRLRLDALARYLQDVAGDDVDDVGITGAWVLRRLEMAMGTLPAIRDEVELTTFCSGYGARFAERRTTVQVAGRPAVEAVALWVYVDDAGRPAPLEEWFFEHYATAAAGRRVRSRLRLAGPPAGAGRRDWPLRASDVDVLDHVNNAASCEAIEDEIRRHWSDRRLAHAEIEYRGPVDLDEPVELVTAPEDSILRAWLTVHGDPRTAAAVRFD